jgi:hypothetical protein
MIGEKKARNSEEGDRLREVEMKLVAAEAKAAAYRECHNKLTESVPTIYDKAVHTGMNMMQQVSKMM